MAGNKLNVKLQRTKTRSAASISPARSQLSDDTSNTLPDLSLLRKSIPTSVTGFAQARDVFDTGTAELKQLLSNECDIIYECRVCRNLFRSLANFISHKRVYCCEKFKTSLHPHFNNNNFMKDDMISIIKTEEDFQDFVRNKNKVGYNHKNGIASDNLGKKISATKDLTSIIERLVLRTESEKQTNDDFEFESSNKIHTRLQSIPDTKNAVYQNICLDKIDPRNSIRDEIAELERLMATNEAILGPDGKVISRNASPESISNKSALDNDRVIFQDDLFCKICKINFATQKTLKYHMKHKHAENRLVYPCPDCTDTFSNSWSVFRHLFKVHRKSATHIRKLRESIQNKAFKLHMSSISIENSKAVEPPADLITEQQRMDQENQAWIDNLEGDGDIPRCGGCGKRFERRAALSSHRQTCQLRKSAQNKINSNVQRKLAKSATKESDEAAFSEPLQKITKVDKSSEKRIEIKIRKDYIKTSPVTVRTSSPAAADEDTIMDSTEQDCDDANVDVRFEKHSSDTLNSIDVNDDTNFVDDSEINFDDIRRICHDESAQLVNKACGQKSKNSLPVQSFSIKIEVEENSCDKSLGMELDSVGNEVCIKKENISEIYPEHPVKIEVEEFECEYCKATFTIKQKLERHMIRHLIWKKFECKLCGIKSCNVSQYERHMKHQHRINLRASRTYKNKSKVTNPNSEKYNTSSQSINDTKSINQKESLNEIVDEMNMSTTVDDEDYKSLISLPIKKTKAKIYKGIRKRRNLIKRSQEAKKKTMLSHDLIDIFENSKLKMSDLDSTDSIHNDINISDDILLSDVKIKMESLKSSKAALKSVHSYNKDVYETNTLEENHHKNPNQHIASSESYTVRRPVRNRIKNFDKDFEYDSSYLPKIKVANKESSISRVFSQKPLLKRKPFLQNEMLAEEMTNSWDEPSQLNQKEETSIQKPYQGALQTISLRVASQGKAMMKQSQLIMARRNTPPFIRTPHRSPIKLPEFQKVTFEKFTPIDLPPTSHYGATKKTTVPLVKTIPLKLLQAPSTVSKTLEKLSSAKTQQKTGTPATLQHQKLTVATQKAESLSNHVPSRKKKSTALHQPTLPTKLMNVTKFDHQALSSDKLNSEEITMLTKSQCKKSTPEVESETVDSSLSILPSNGKSSSSFVNISLRQLKDLQKVKKVPKSPVKNITKNISVLKNLEENNEIRISKVMLKGSKKDCDSSKSKQTVEISDSHKNQSDKQKPRVINIKNLITSKNKYIFSQKYITPIISNAETKNLNTVKNKSNKQKKHENKCQSYSDTLESKGDSNIDTINQTIESEVFANECSKFDFDDSQYQIINYILPDSE
ncbi:uncharacterized protein LOC143917373 isoform X2 [Arctopsyche grandis]|uniref:uncharacterized protein LOC143917373 isoform X2 n=1 Tax=Arctopsyche grandis TaxID=121162 RepID=UPI00406D76D0